MGEIGGHKVASIQSATELPLSSRTRLGDTDVGLEGVESTESTTRRALADGAVQEAVSVTRGQYRLTLARPDPGAAASVDGTMTVEVRSETRRL